MTDVIEDALRSWGVTKRKATGAPPRSIFGRISDEGSVGAAIRGRQPDPPEVMLNDALLIARAIRAAIDAHKLTYNQNLVLHLHYATWGPISLKVKKLNLKRYDYFKLLNTAKKTLTPFYLALCDDSMTGA